jgi:hypothetical protein
MTGVVVTSPPSAITGSYTASPASLTGWGSTGGMVFHAWASATNTISWEVCNQTSLTIGYSALPLVLSAK